MAASLACSRRAFLRSSSSATCCAPPLPWSSRAQMGLRAQASRSTHRARLALETESTPLVAAQVPADAVCTSECSADSSDTPAAVVGAQQRASQKPSTSSEQTAA
eukprot:5051387-Prymnesium_polylepis.1